MALKPWLNNGKPIMINGRKVYCDHCPCDEDCEEKMEAVKAAKAQDPAWRLIEESRAGYICPGDVSDSMSDSTAHYTGSLIVLMARNTAFSSPYKYAVHALEYERYSDGLRRVYACLCNCSGDYTFAELDGYGIAGTVYADNDVSCRPADLCQVYEMELDYLQGIFGGTLYGEGFFDWLGNQDDFHYISFRKAWVFEGDDSNSGGITTKLAWINCACSQRASVRWKGGEIGVHQVDGFCESPCADLLVLRERALINDWTWHDAGIIVHHAFDFGYMGDECHICDFYDPDDRIRSMGAAEDGAGHIYYVDCGCNGIETINLTDWPMMAMPPEGCTPGQDFWQYIDFPFVCRCNDPRELLLTCPEIFGVIAVAWSSDQKVRLTYIYDDPMEPTPVISEQVSTVGGLLGGGDDYIDYRTLSVVRQACPSGYELWAYNDQGSRWGTSRLYQGDYEPVFLGVRTTWGQDPDVGGRNGHSITWWGQCSGGEPGYFDTEQEARDYMDGYILTDPTAAGLRDYYQGAHTCITEPITGMVDTPGRVYQDGGYWVGIAPKRCFDGPSGYYGTYVYNINYLYTNKGLLLNGVDGYYLSWLVYGIKGSHGDPSWGDLYGHSGVPWEDETLTASWVDPDFHWCDPDFTPPIDDDESDSMSDSISE